MTMGCCGGCGIACAGICSPKRSVRGVFVGAVKPLTIGQHSDVRVVVSTGSCYRENCGSRLVIYCEAEQTQHSCLAQETQYVL